MIRLVTDEEASPEPTFDWQRPRVDSQRGVEEVVLRADDWRGFELIGSSGGCIMYVEWPAERVTQVDIDDLWRTLDEMDPPGPKMAS